MSHHSWPVSYTHLVVSKRQGLVCAWLLSQKHEVTLYEAEHSLGGHTNTIDVTIDGLTHPVDTGFLVYNTATYPNLTALFAHLGVCLLYTSRCV